jgi:Domain of unknown function (DUF4276)
MIRIVAFVEGSTEEMFIQKLMYDHLRKFNIFIDPIILSKSSSHKGGVSTYGKIKKDIFRKCKEDQSAWVTTMIDYYGLPHDFPKIASKPSSNPDQCVEFLETSFYEDMNSRNFIPNLMLHEFEALLYTQPAAFEYWGFDKTVIEKLDKIKEKFETPEHINSETPPSKRILSICPKYQKVLHGNGIASQIGFDVIRRECKHFDRWVKKLENL